MTTDHSFAEQTATGSAFPSWRLLADKSCPEVLRAMPKAQSAVRRGMGAVPLIGLHKTFVACAIFAMSFAQHASVAAGAPSASRDFDAGFQQRWVEIRAEIQPQIPEADRTYAFSKLVIDGMLPPVLRQISGPAGDSDVCSGDRSFAISLPAQAYCVASPSGGSCSRVHWRDFLFAGMPLSTASATYEPAVSKDFERGKAEADRVFDGNMKRLNEIFVGMVHYRTLEGCGILPLRKSH